MGIEQLVDSFMGNPKPLEAKVERDNKGLPPGAIPRDLEEAIALQKIAEVQTGAQNQQAMQAGGAQPSVVQKLHQMLAMAQQRQQAQMPQGAQQMPGQMPRPMPQGMPQQPVMAAHGGSLDQLMSNLGRHYANGGIVAFSKPTEENNRSLVKDPDSESSQFVQDIGKLPQAFDEMKQRAREEDAVRAEQDRRMAERQQAMQDARRKTSLFNYLFGSPATEKEGLAKLTELSNAPLSTPAGTSTAAPAAPLDAETQKLLRLAASKADTGVNTNPALKPVAPAPAANTNPAAPRVNVPSTNTPATTQAMDPNSLRGLLEAGIRKDLGKDEEAEWQKGATRHEQFMGLDKLLAPKNARIAEEQALIKKIQGERLPAWVAGAERASKPILAGGIGTMLNQLGSGMQGQREAYNTEDLGFLDKIGRMQDEVDKLKIEGKYKAAAAGEASIKDAIADRRQAMQSGTSLLNTDELIAQRKQAAKDAAAARLAATGNRGELAADKQQLAELKALQGAVTSQLKNAFGTERKRLQTQLEAINGEIAKMAGMSTMAAAPGAGSPGGTPADINALLKKYGGK
jgi:hypothetical protein